jgi:hypothetical protein
VRRYLRVVLFVATAMAAWLIAVPSAMAQDGAPLCDAREATVIAPPPPLDVPSGTVTKHVQQDDCLLHDVDEAGYDEGRRSPEPPPSFDGERALPAKRFSLIPPTGVRITETDSGLSGRAGARARVERPPRA